ncbi:MAG: hypothetical protein IJK67_02315 [Bacilli bacterium]|nr:hypothetical protein [Bacilli bacterium]
MNEIDITPDKLVSAYKYLNNMDLDFPKINEVNIPQNIASKLNTDEYYNKLYGARDALVTKEAINNVGDRLKKIIIALAKIGVDFMGDTDFLNNIMNFGGSLIDNEEIDISSLLIDGVNAKPGDVITINGQWGPLYKVYIPLSVNKDTDITVFYPGTDGIEGPNDSKVVLDYVNSKPDQIVFMSFASGNDSGDPMLNSLNQLMNEYGLNRNINVFGFSRGAQFGERFARSCIESGINVENLVLIDPANFGSSLDWQTNKDVISVFKESGTKVTVFSQDGDRFMSGYSYRYANDEGIDINVISTVQGHNNHPQINRELILNGGLDFFRGEGQLDNLDYYKVYDGNTWRQMTPNDASSLRK